MQENEGLELLFGLILRRNGEEAVLLLYAQSRESDRGIAN